MRLRASPAARIILGRIAQAPAVMIGVTLLTFALMNLLPGGSAFSLAGPGATPQQVNELAVKLGLNKPFIERYFHWLGGLLSGHLGNSIVSNEPVSQLIRERFPVTFELVFVALFVGLLVTIPCALAAARHPGGPFDRLSTIVSAGGLALPGFVLGILLILLFAVHLRIFPATGFTPITKGVGPNLRSLVLPATASVSLSLAGSSAYSEGI